MSYATQNDLERVYGESMVMRLADHDNSGTLDEQDQAAINDALTSASSTVDGYLATRYPVPLANPPLVIKNLTIDIAWYRLAYSRLKQTTEMRQRYEDAIDFLKDVSRGKASIGLDTNEDGVSDDQSGSVTSSTSFLDRA